MGRNTYGLYPGTLRLIKADITTLNTDAIVNAANAQLSGGAGVNGAIQRAAGPELLEACRVHGGCPTGQARITEGFRLPARFVIHAVGPVWHGGDRREDELLASAYRASLGLAAAYGLRSIAFPAISCGIYGYPLEQAAQVALDTVRGAPFDVTFALFSEEILEVFAGVLAEG